MFTAFFFFFSNKETLKGFGRCFCCCGLVFGGNLWGVFCWFVVVFCLGFYLFCVAVCVCLFNITALFFPVVKLLVCIVICTCFKNIHCTCLLLQVDHN